MTESQITQANFIENIQRIRESFLFADLDEELDRFVHRELQQVMDRFVVQFNFQHVGLESFSFAFGAADIEIAQELHLDLFESRAGTTFATAASGIERERARGQPLRHRFRSSGEKFADPIIKTEIQNRGRSRRTRERRLIDHHDFVNSMRAADRFARADFLVARLSLGREQLPIEHVVNQRRFTRTRYTGHAGENAERKIDIDVLKVVFASAGDLHRRCRSSPLLRNRNRFPAAQVIGGQRFIPKQKLIERATKNQLASAFAATGTDVDQVIGCANDLFLVFDHEEGIAAVAQIVHDANEPADVARMQPDAWLVHHEKRVHERRAKTGREIDPLNFAAAQCACGTIEREITDTDFTQIIQARADFIAQHLCSRIVRCDVDLRQ